MTTTSISTFRRRADPPPLWADSVVDLLSEVAATPLERVREIAERRKLTMAPRPDWPWLSGYPRVIHIRDTAGDRFPGCGILGLKASPIGGQVSTFEYLRRAVIDNALSHTGRHHVWAWSTKEMDDLLVFIEWLRENHNIELPANIWLGTRIETTSDLNRLPNLLRAGAPATKRFVILEPTKEQVDLKAYLGGINWVIAGQSPQRAACLFDANVARQLRDDCRRAKTTLFLTSIASSASPIKTMGGKNWYFWPEELQIRAYPDPTYLLHSRNPEAMARKIKSLRNSSLEFAEAKAWPYFSQPTGCSELPVQSWRPCRRRASNWRGRL